MNVPMLLEFGMPPPVAAATAAYINLFTSGTNLVHYTQEIIVTNYTQEIIAINYNQKIIDNDISLFER